MKLYESIYTYGSYLFYILYAITIFGLWNESKTYLNAVDYFLQLFISMLLIYFYNPLNNHTFGPIDKKIAFSAGIFLITSTTLNAFLKKIENPLSKTLDENCGCN